MKIPINIEMSLDTANILSETLLAYKPEEGCAILIGKENYFGAARELQLKIDRIWPSSNIWKPETFSDLEITDNKPLEKLSNLSRKNRFAVDPREQLLAQKWARSKKLKILGIAHSHPYSEGIPSMLDLSLSCSCSLMIIIDKSAKIRAWWITYNQHFIEIDIIFRKLSKAIEQ